MSYLEVYRRSLDDPEGFWAEAAAGLAWSKPWERVLDATDAPFYEWFRGGEINTCYNALDRHCESGRSEQAALIYDSPVTGQVRAFRYGELRDLVARFAGATLVRAAVSFLDRPVVRVVMRDYVQKRARWRNRFGGTRG